MNNAQAPTVEQINLLTKAEIANILIEWTYVKHTAEWKSGCDAMSGVYGLVMDDDEILLDLEDAARKKSSELGVLSAVRWAYLAIIYPETVASSQKQALLLPWRSRSNA